MKTYWILTITVAMLTVESCNPVFPASGTSSSNTPTLNPSPEQITQETPKASAAPISPINTPDFSQMTPASVTDPFVGLAKRDLADRLGISIEQIDLLSTSDLTWPDISQGCAPGQGQKLLKGRAVSGYRIWLDVEGTQYVYHVGLDGKVIFCQN